MNIRRSLDGLYDLNNEGVHIFPGLMMTSVKVWTGGAWSGESGQRRRGKNSSLVFDMYRL